MENATEEGLDVIPKYHRIVKSVILIAITLVGIFGNTLVLIAYCLSRRLQTKTNIFVINLATADFLTCVFLPAIALSFIIDAQVHVQPWLNTVCAVTYGTIWTLLFTSVATLTFIAVNRYVLITKSKETYERIYQTKFIFVFICVSWLFPILYVTLQLVFGRRLLFGYSEKVQACIMGLGHPKAHLYNVLDLANIILAITVMAYSYGGIHLFLRRHNKQMQEGMRSKSMGLTMLISYGPYRPGQDALLSFIYAIRHERNGRVMNASPVSENQINITKNLFYLFVAFLMCFGPAVVSEAVNANVIVLSYTRAIIAFNSCLNPAIYGIKHPVFRNVMYNILFRKWSEIPEPVFKWMNSEVPCPAGSRSEDLDAVSIAVSVKNTVV